jgi:hypothetical protein
MSRAGHRPAQHPDGTIVLWQQPDGWWRWRWTPDAGPEADQAPGLVSNEAYPEVSEARSSARTAYPAARLVDPTQEDSGHAGAPAAVRRPAGGLALLAAGVVVLAWACRAWPRRRGVPG